MIDLKPKVLRLLGSFSREGVRAPNISQTLEGKCVNIFLTLQDGTVELRSLERLSLLSRRPRAHQFAVSALLVLSDTILTGDAAGTLVSWRAEASTPGEDWEKLWQREHRGRVVAISQGGGHVIVTAALDSFIRIWNPSGDVLFAIPEHRVWLGSLSMSMDNSLMATDGRDNAVYLYRFSED